MVVGVGTLGWARGDIFEQNTPGENGKTRVHWRFTRYDSANLIIVSPPASFCVCDHPVSPRIIFLEVYTCIFHLCKPNDER